MKHKLCHFIRTIYTFFSFSVHRNWRSRWVGGKNSFIASKVAYQCLLGDILIGSTVVADGSSVASSGGGMMRRNLPGGLGGMGLFRRYGYMGYLGMLGGNSAIANQRSSVHGGYGITGISTGNSAAKGGERLTLIRQNQAL